MDSIFKCFYSDLDVMADELDAAKDEPYKIAAPKAIDLQEKKIDSIKGPWYIFQAQSGIYSSPCRLSWVQIPITDKGVYTLGTFKLW